MALVKCPDCGRDVSDVAPACPACGRPATPPTAKQARPAESATVFAIAVVVVLAVAIFAVWFALRRPDSNANVPSVPEVAAASSEAPDCRICVEAAASPASFYFIGTFLDAKCVSQPVAHADVTACSAVRSHGPIQVMFTRALGTHKASESAEVDLRGEVEPQLAARMFQRDDDGKCVPYSPKGLKVAPAGCDGRKVCRTASGDLACGNCRNLPNGCPDYEGARVFALLDPPVLGAASDPKATTLKAAAAPALAATNACGAQKCSGTTTSDIESALAFRAKQAHRCYDNAVAQDPTLRGKVSIALRIGPDGSACSASVAINELPSAPAVANCVAGYFRGQSFPAPNGGCVDVTVPVNFVPRQ